MFPYPFWQNCYWWPSHQVEPEVGGFIDLFWFLAQRWPQIPPFLGPLLQHGAGGWLPKRIWVSGIPLMLSERQFEKNLCTYEFCCVYRFSWWYFFFKDVLPSSFFYPNNHPVGRLVSHAAWSMITRLSVIVVSIHFLGIHERKEKHGTNATTSKKILESPLR